MSRRLVALTILVRNIRIGDVKMDDKYDCYVFRSKVDGFKHGLGLDEVKEDANY